MNNCIFCKIVQRQLPTNLIYEDDEIIAFNDIHPKAPIHQLIIPRRHIATLNDLESEDALLFGKMVLVAQHLAKQANIAESGYRIITNCNRNGGQEVFHLHLHLLGGKRLAI